MNISSIHTLIDLLEDRAERDPSLRLFTFLPEGEGEQGGLASAELAARARSVAAWLAELGLAGQRIVLLFPQGLEFIAGYFGCAYAGAVAAPAPMPHPSRLARTLPRLRGMIADARPAAVLTCREGLEIAAQVMAELPGDTRGLPWLALEDCPSELGTAWRRPALDPEAPAHLQYTSGSTSSPKGTIITHANILANSRCIQHGWQYSRASRSVVWVPHFHDDGLVQGLIQPIYTGYPCVLFPASAFVARPGRWLRAITKYQATHTGGPNFAYELGIRKVSEAERAALDLASWEMAYNAAEPVRAETLRRFYQQFEPVGLRWSTLAPCFGLAEATLLVSTARRADGPRIVAFEGAALEKQGLLRIVPEDTPGARVFVSCGAPAVDTEVVIVDPSTGERCPADRVGEVLVKSPCIAAGYLDRPEESERTFRARLDDGSGPYLRTGDQGFLLDGELFITGRIKDLIIIRGENRYPQDIEWTVERSHAAIAPGGIAAFSVEAGGEERLAVAAEVKAKPGEGVSEQAFYEGILNAMREAISHEHDLRPWALVLLAPGNLPKTSSGKIQRRAMARALMDDTIPALARLTDALGVPSTHEADAAPGAGRSPAAAPGHQVPSAGRSLATGKSAAEIEAFLLRYLATELGVRPDELAPDVPFSRYGLDSELSVRMAADLSDFIGAALPPVTAWNYPTIRALSRYLAGEGEPLAPHSRRQGPSEPIAIIGAGCRFPGGVRDLEGLWRLLDQGVDAVVEVPRERWDIDALYDPDPDAPGRMSTRWGGFLQEPIDRFDPGFFEISPREAAEMDPQQRLLLEVSWEALEQAGQPLSRLRGSDTGVFMGISSNEYQHLGMARAGTLEPHLFLGTAHSTGVGRLSYWLGLMGPNMPVDTACSSSLVAVHLACQALRAGDCSMALAGGVNLMLTPDATVCLSRMRAMSPTGRCHAFSADADGYVRGEGCGVVVLKRLADAQRDGDPILAVIRGSAVNQDGRSHGLTAPNGPAQEEVIRRALTDAGIEPSAVGYVEAHGTGTPLGDPIEVAALANVLGHGRPPERPVVIGSVKTNIGHAESAAGVAGLLKAVLALEHGRIPASLHLGAPNPRVPWSELPVQVAAQAMSFAASAGGPRIAGVSSFGMSGTNAHVIVEQPPPAPEAARGLSHGAAYLVPLSAKRADALAPLARSYSALLAQPTASLHDIAYTASVRRTHHSERIALVGRSADELAQALDAFARGERPAGLWAGKAGAAPKVVLVFSGQGSQWAAMGQQLLAEEPVFAQALAACAQALQPFTRFSLLEELARPEASSRLGETEVAQCALFAIEVALAALLRSWGVVPAAVLGHSVGEIAAAHVAGILDLGEAARLVALRARIMQEATGKGRMVMVALPEDEARRELEGLTDRLGIAAINDPGQVVLSGGGAALDTVVARLAAHGIEHRPLRVDYAFHSPQMMPLARELEQALAGLEPKRAAIPMISTVTGQPIAGPELTAAYWGDNVCKTVRFAQAVEAARAAGGEIFVEVGPHPVLTANVQRTLAARELPGQAIPTLRRNCHERARMLETLAALFVGGVDLDASALYPAGGRVVALPAYPWQRERCWLEAGGRPAVPAHAAAGHPLLGPAIASSLHEGTHLFQAALSVAAMPYLAEHLVQGQAVFPGVGYLEMALAACAQVLGVAEPVVEELALTRVLILPEDGERIVQVAVTEDGPGRVSFGIASRAPGERGWQRHAAGTARVADRPLLAREPAPLVLHEPADAAERARAHHEQMRRCELDYGPAFRGLAGLWQQDGAMRGRVRLPAGLGDRGYRMHPAMLDACIRVASGLFLRPDDTSAVVPVGIERAHLAAQPGREVWVVATRRPYQPEADAAAGEVCDVELFAADSAGASLCVGRIEGLRVLRLEAAPHALAGELLHMVVFRPAEAPASAAPAEGTWLVLSDRGSVGAELAGLLRSRGRRVVRIVASGSYERPEPDLYRIRPAHGGDAQRLLEQAVGAGETLAGVVCLWSLDATAPERATGASMSADLEHGSVSAMIMAQALVRRGAAQAPRLWLVTRGAQALGDTGAAVSVAHAPIWGLGRTLALEHPELRATCVDLAPVPERGEAELVLRELASQDAEDQIALRQGRRHVARLVRGRPQALPATETTVHADAAYLITGGFGGLGLVLARALVDRVARRLVLAGRRAPGEDARRAIAAMEALGTDIQCVQADVSERADIVRMLAAIRERGAPLRGVVHAAAVLDDHTLLEQSAQSFQRVFAPKALGAWHLHELTQDDPLDFFVLYSSAAALLGSPGQANYAAANAFLDALAWERVRQGRVATSIQWGAFSGVGLAAAQANRGNRLERLGIASLTPDQGTSAFFQLTSQRPPVVGFVRLDAAAWRSAFAGAQAAPFLSELQAPQSALSGPPGRPRALAAELMALPPQSRLARLVDHVIREVASVLRLDPKDIDPSAPFLSLGVDSLMSVELRGRLEASLELRLPAMLLFKYPDASSLAQHLLSLLVSLPAAPHAPEGSPSAAAAGAARDQDQDRAVQPIPRLALDPSGMAPVSPGQARLWFFDRLSPGTALYNMEIGVRMHGPLDRAALQRSIQAIAQRHATLRTTFASVDGQPVARVAQAIDMDLPLVDLRALPEPHRNDELAQRSTELATAPFDLERGPLTRVMLIALDGDTHVLRWVLHHIISDAWSATILLAELAHFYRAYTEGTPAELPPLPVEHTDVAAWQNAALATQEHQRSIAWWQEQLAGVPRLELPVTRAVPAPSFAGDAVALTIPPELTARIEALASREGCTLFVALCAAWAALLHRYTGQEDFAIGTMSAGRSRNELASLVGFFVNTLVLRCDASGAPSFRALAQRLRDTVAGALDHEDVHFDEVVRATGAERGRDLNPLYQASFVLESVPLPQLDLPQARWTPIFDRIDGSVAGTAKNELGLTLIKLDGALSGTIEFASDLFDTALVERMAGHLVALLQAIVAAPERAIAELDLLAPAERAQLAAWSQGAHIQPRAVCVHQLIEEQARRAPDAVAVESGSERITYAQLDAQANRLAHYLRELGVGPKAPVGLVAERSPATMVALLAIMKAGGAYVPLDVSYPRERLAYMLADARVSVLLTPSHLAGALPAHDAAVVHLDTDAPPWAERPAVAQVSDVRPNSMLYVIYTSGSTGQPKGVVVEHRQVVALLAGILAQGSRYAAPCKVLHRSSLAFDVAVLETLAPLAAGAAIVMAPGDTAKTPSALAALIRQHGVTYADFPPALLSLMLAERDFVQAGSLRVVTVGGEALDPALCGDFAKTCRAELWNNYGPTEATVEATAWPAARYAQTGSVRIGRPLPGYRVYVLDKHGAPCPAAIPGELCIGGPGVARGYLNQPEHTQARFVPDPFAPEPGARMYRTGDRARWTHDGELEFLGRLDHQVKLRGYRIELGEIEAAIAAHRSVRACAVLLREDVPGHKLLAAYVQPTDVDATPDRLRDFLRARLPEHMIPSVFLILSELPLLPSGKIDRQALPAPELTREGTGAGYTAPRTDLERELVAIWEQLLGIQPIGIHDDFFAIGGHSLLAIRLAAMLEKRYTRALPLAQIFARRSVAEMAEALANPAPEAVFAQAHSASQSPIIALRQSGTQPPLFCVQPTGATAFCYADLARELGPDQPVYGLQEGILEPGSPHLQSIEALAAHFLRHVRDMLPNGPYRFTGWSFGGAIAFEMAQQLRREGIAVDRLIMLDTPVPATVTFKSGEPLEHLHLVARYAQLQGANLEPDRLLALSPEVALATLSQWLEQAGWFATGRAERFVVGLVANIEAHWVAQKRYQIQPYGGELIMVRAPQPMPYRVAEPSWDWSPYCTGSYRVCSIPAPHSKMVYPPYVGILARLMRRLLDGEDIETQSSTEKKLDVE